MALFRGIQEYIARDANNIARVIRAHFRSGNNDIIAVEYKILFLQPKAVYE